MDQGWSAVLERRPAGLGRWLLALACDALGNRPRLVLLVTIIGARRIRGDGARFANGAWETYFFMHSFGLCFNHSPSTSTTSTLYNCAGLSVSFLTAIHVRGVTLNDSPCCFA